MKKIALTSLFILMFAAAYSQTLKGAWLLNMQTSETVLLITDSYFTYSMYSSQGKVFNQTWGGKYEFNGEEITVDIEFNSLDSTEVGKKKKLKVRLIGDLLKYSVLTFKRVDNANETDLAGTWQITARANELGVMENMPASARKTVKVMSGTRFQWIAMNSQTGQFFGTGGGTYTYDGGIYTETILFFPRNPDRIGAYLSFKADVNNSVWVHSGNSSTGTPIKEIWQK